MTSECREFTHPAWSLQGWQGSKHGVVLNGECSLNVLAVSEGDYLVHTMTFQLY